MAWSRPDGFLSLPSGCTLTKPYCNIVISELVFTGFKLLLFKKYILAYFGFLEAYVSKFEVHIYESICKHIFECFGSTFLHISG